MKRLYRLVLLAGVLSQLVIHSLPVAAQTPDPLDTMISTMSLQDRVGQLFMVRFWGTDANGSFEQLLTAIHPGGAVLLDPNLGTPEQITQLTNEMQTLATTTNAKIPLLIAVDQEGGTVQRLMTGFTRLPDPLVLGALSDAAVIRDYGAMVAQEMAAVGINMNLAPVVDLMTTPNNPVVAHRMMGDNPPQVSRTASSLIAGMGDKNVVGVIKHFPGHGDVADTHVGSGVLNHDRALLYSRELVPFFTTITPVVMMGHITTPSLDPSGLPASLSPTMVKILREDGKFDGVIMTDAMDMGAITTQYPYATAVVMAVKAGIDLVLLGANTSNALQIAGYNAVLAAVQSGAISEQQINASVKRILLLKDRFHLLQWTALPIDSTQARITASNSAAVLSETYAAALTVARNNGNLLPIKSAHPIGIIYPNIYPAIMQDCQTDSNNLTNLTGLAINFLPFSFELGKAAKLANESDTIIVFTSDADSNIAQQRLVAALPPDKTIVVALKSPYDLRAFPNVAAYILAYDPVDPAFNAACRAIFGKQATTGILPVTLFPTLVAGTSINLP